MKPQPREEEDSFPEDTIEILRYHTRNEPIPEGWEEVHCFLGDHWTKFSHHGYHGAIIIRQIKGYHTMSLSMEEIVERLREEIKRAGGINYLAREWRTSPASIEDVLGQRREPGVKMCRRMGIVKTFVPLYRTTNRRDKSE